MVCPWQVFHKDINMYEIIKAGGENNLLLNTVEFEILCLFMSF